MWCMSVLLESHSAIQCVCNEHECKQSRSPDQCPTIAQIKYMFVEHVSHSTRTEEDGLINLFGLLHHIVCCDSGDLYNAIML